MNEQALRTRREDTAVRTDALWIGLIVFMAALSISPLIPQMIGYILVLGVYVLFVAYLFVTNRFEIVYHWAILPMIVLIWVIFALTTLLDPTTAGLLRLGAFTVITGVNLFVVPAVIDSTALYDALAYVSGFLVLIGLPTVFFGAYGVAGIRITPWPTTLQLFGIELHTLRSILGNPNPMTAFSALGAVAGGAIYIRSRAPWLIGLIGLDVFAVYLAGGRAGLLALVVTIVLYIVDRFFGRSGLAISVAVGTLVGLVGFAMAFRIVPGPGVIAHVDLGDRRVLWRATYKAVLDRPIIGWGPGIDKKILSRYIAPSNNVSGTHNSYLRMFLLGGILGGVSYLIVTVSSVVIGLQNTRSETVFLFLLFIAFAIIQLFTARTIFGLSLLSTLGALIVGYIQSSSVVSKRAEFDVQQLIRNGIIKRF